MAGNGWKLLRASRKEVQNESDKDAVDGSKLLGLALSCVLCLLSFEMHGYYYSAKDIALVVIQACSRAVSINQTCKDMKRCPAQSTVRHHLSKLRIREMERSINDVLPRWAKVLPRRALKIAIDLTYIPYHGKPKRSKAELKKNGPAKGDTTWFHVYASAYVILYGKRYNTLALKYARRHEPLTHARVGMPPE